jgi:ankyrin repeat protein
MSALMLAVEEGDLESVKRLVAEGADVKEAFVGGYTPFLLAACQGHIPIMHWLLTEGGSSLTEKTTCYVSALLLVTAGAYFAAMQYLLEKHGASMTESDNIGRTVWSELKNRCRREGSAAELSSLLKVMVMLDDAPADVCKHLTPQHAELCARGQRFRAQLPSYLEQQRAAVITQ